MKKRVDSLTRIGKLASQMHDLGRWRLSAIQHEQACLSDDLRAVLEALETGELAYGAQAKLSARRVRALQKRLDALAHESERVSRAARVHGVRAKLAEQAAETAGKAWREHEARKDLAEIVERTLIKRDASQG
ncbi:hypothetical protein [Roseiarcus sp.]|uniref:hypothetical protein n=1 Tax=Roseiarcus sp. TaxID=1969460 RepID=UPI003F94AB44